MIVADAGFGKSTLLATWARRHPSAWCIGTSGIADLAAELLAGLREHVPALPGRLDAAVQAHRGPDAPADEPGRAEAFAALVCSELARELTDDLALIVDDAHMVGADPAAVRLLDALCLQAPPRLHLLVASRTALPFSIDRLRARGEVIELGAGDLAFDKAATERLVAETLGGEDRRTAERIVALTGGWPAATRLALEALRSVPETQRETALAGFGTPGSPLFGDLAAEVIEFEPREVRELLRRVAPLESFDLELCAALGIVAADRRLAELERRAFFLDPVPGRPGWFSLHPLMRAFLAEAMPLPPEELRRVREDAASWLGAAGDIEGALECLLPNGPTDRLVEFLRQRGADLLRAGRVTAVLRAVETVPGERRDAELDTVAGEAHQVRGDWDAALTCFRRVAADGGELDPGIAWRMCLIHYLSGEIEAASEVCARARLDGSEPGDEARLLAWHASIEWFRQDAEACRTKAKQAFEVASTAEDPGALAAAHTALALLAALDADRAANDMHYQRALEYAERANDMLQVIRIRTNRGSRSLEEGSYEEAITELDRALELADLAGFAFFRALALHNRGECKFRLGRFEEATADLQAALDLQQSHALGEITGTLAVLAEVQRERGNLAQARGAYEEAVRRGERSQDPQGFVPALAGLARLVVSEDPERATELVGRALDLGPGMGWVTALLAAAQVDLAAGRRDEARKRAAEAAEAARVRRDRAGLAEALELEALTASDPAAETARIEEAVRLWREVGNPLGEARAELWLAALRQSERGQALAARAERRLRDLGAVGHAAWARALLASWAEEEQAATPVAVEVLGTFRVLREGDPVSAGEWQSRKARDLLKLLVARRGRPLTRDALMEALWPGDDPAKVTNRLSVALSTVRSVFDPERRFAADRFVRIADGTVSLDLDRVAVDLERFLRDAGNALAARGRGEPEAHEMLIAAEAAYRGDFLEEDPYVDWAVAPREEARAIYLEVERALTADAIDRGDPDAAVRYQLRTLERDPYDEEAHLGYVSALVASRRHGEARRAYRLYVRRMAEIDVAPAPFPAREPIQPTDTRP